MSEIIQSLWIGNKLGIMEQLSIKSFLDNGHTYHLYCYNPIENVPEGTILKDASEIVPKNEIFTYKNGSYAAFANYFRFHMLYEKGGCWVDTDVVCIKPLIINDPIAFATEPHANYIDNRVTSFLIKLPKYSEEAKEAIKIQKKHKILVLKGKMRWSSSVITIKHIVEKFKLDKYIKDWRLYCSCYYGDAKSLINKNYKCHNKAIKNINEFTEETMIIHMWNEVWRRNKMDKNKKFPNDCLFEQLKRKYNIN